MNWNSDQSLLICPVCSGILSLRPDQKNWQCENHHTFDVAKQGYVNLLTNALKKSKFPGDSKEMVKARRDFLSKGHYLPLSDRINTCVADQLPARGADPYNILDIGCGDGYYTASLMRSTLKNGIPARYFGLDISKDAVKYASGETGDITWIVANSHHMPLQDDSFDCVLSVFSPVKISECLRVLRRNGIFVRVLPGMNHLIQIRNIIYPKVILNEEQEPVDACEGLVPIESSKVAFDMELNKEDLLSLVQMTPHYWKTSKAGKEPLDSLDHLTVTVDMQLLLYKRI